MRFRSAITLYLWLPLITGLMITPFFGGLLYLFPILFLVAVFIGWLWYTTWYELGADKLTIRCGWQWWTIQYDQIVSIKPSGNPISAPAFSLNRLEIRYTHRRSVLISPVRRELFLQLIQDKIASAKGAIIPTPTAGTSHE